MYECGIECHLKVGTSVLPPDGDPFFGRWAGASILDFFLRTGSFVDALGSLQEAALLHWTAALTSWNRPNTSVAVAICSAAGARRCQMRDIFRQRVLRANCGNSALRCLASLGQSVVPRIKILAFLAEVRC